MAQRDLKLKKRQFSISSPAYRWLVSEAKRLGVSVSEVLRRAIDKVRDEAARQ